MTATLRRVSWLCLVGLSLSFEACGKASERTSTREDRAAAASVQAAVLPTPAWPTRVGTIGRKATSAEVAKWNIDVNPTGAGLPPGEGTYAAGATIFAQKCASCHGAAGEGIGPSPRLIGREPRSGFPFSQDFRIPKTIGNYWPYATTLYDYLNRAMPLTAPGSLSPNEIYSVVAFLLVRNEIIPQSTIVNARSLPRIRMPAREHFVVEDRTGGPVFR